MISFRVSEEEFRDFRYVCLAEGFSSFSDLVRVAVQQLVAKHERQGEHGLQAAMEQIYSRMDELDRSIKQLRKSSTVISR